MLLDTVPGIYSYETPRNNAWCDLMNGRKTMTADICSSIRIIPRMSNVKMSNPKMSNIKMSNPRMSKCYLNVFHNKFTTNAK